MNIKLIKEASQQIADTSLNRLYSTLKDKDFAIITAYRINGADGKPISKKENIQRNRDLRAQLNNAKMGVYQLVGHWQEGPEGMSYEEAKAQNLLEDTIERSYVVPRPSNVPEDEFLAFMKELMTIDGLTQDAYVYKNDEGAFVIYKDDSKEFLGKNVTLNKIGQAYSQSVLRNGAPFVFDSVDAPVNAMGKMAFHKRGILYLR